MLHYHHVFAQNVSRRSTRWRLAVGCLVFLLCAGLTICANASERDLTIAAGGDVAWPRGWSESHVAKVASRTGLFALLNKYLSAADLRFVNLETPLTNRAPAIKKKYMIVTSPERLTWLTEAGFNLFSLANNHMADAGTDGIVDTIATLKDAKAAGLDLWWSGADPEPDRAMQPVILAPPGKSITVGMVAVGNNGAATVASFSHAKQLRKVVRELRKKVDVVVVSVHAGTEYQHQPEARIVQRFRELADDGADIVLGHHPHVVRGVEARGRSLIFYSLGNFSFASLTTRHHAAGAKLYGMLPLIEIRNGRVFGARVIPLYVNNREAWTLPGQPTLKPTPFRPQPLGGAYAQAMLSDLQAWTAAIPGNDSQLEIRGDEGWIGVRAETSSRPEQR